MEEHKSARKFRALYVATHPIQYLAPLLRKMATDPRLELSVAYCTMHGAEPAADAGFGVQVQWDIPLLDGYRWVLLPNRSPRPRVGGFFGLINPGVYRLVRSGHFDAVITQTGYNSVTYWMLLASAKLSGTPLIFCTDASSMRPFDTKAWKSFIKPLVAPIFFRLNEIIAAGSTAGCEMFRNIGIPANVWY